MKAAGHIRWMLEAKAPTEQLGRHFKRGDSEVLTFNAIDVETANADRAAVKLASFTFGTVRLRIDGKPWLTRRTGDPWNVSIHGIDEDDVRDSPTLPEVRAELCAIARVGPC